MLIIDIRYIDIFGKYRYASIYLANIDMLRYFRNIECIDIYINFTIANLSFILICHFSVSASKSVINMGKKSSVWDFFTQDTTSKIKRAKCNECQEYVRTSGNTSNLYTHLRIHHPATPINVSINKKKSTNKYWCCCCYYWFSTGTLLMSHLSLP